MALSSPKDDDSESAAEQPTESCATNASQDFTPLLYWAAAWILTTILSSLYVHERDGAGWPVVIWTVQMLLLGFVQIPAIVYTRRWLENNQLLGKCPNSFQSLFALSLLLLLFSATFYEGVVTIWAIVFQDKLPLHENARFGFLIGLIIGPASLLAITAFVGLLYLLSNLFFLAAHFSTRAGSPLKYPLGCPSCMQPLPLDLPRLSQEVFDRCRPLLIHVNRENIRQCPHCPMPILPVPRDTSGARWHHLRWVIVTFLLTLPVGLHDGWGWTTALWAMEVWLIPYGLVPAGLKVYAWLCQAKFATECNDQPVWKQAFYAAFLLGMPLGAFFGVVFCLLYNWKIPIHFAGQLGLLIGPLIVGWCILQALLLCGVIILLARTFTTVKAFFKRA